MQANKIYLLLTLLCMQAYAGTIENITIQGNKSYSDQQMQNIMGITQGQEFSNKDKKVWNICGFCSSELEQYQGSIDEFNQQCSPHRNW